MRNIIFLKIPISIAPDILQPFLLYSAKQENSGQEIYTNIRDLLECC